jgi:hypothetical protein
MKITVLFALLLSQVVFSAEDSILKCDASELSTQNTFSLLVGVEFENNTWESNGDAIVITRKRGKDSISELNVQKLKGTYNTIPAGSLAQNEVYTFAHVDKEGEVVRAILNVNHPGAFSSSVTTNDGYTYKTKCAFE